MTAGGERISHPAMTDIRIDWGDLAVSEVFPVQVPDLFVGRPVVLTGRYSGSDQAVVKVTGKVGEETRVIPMPVNLNPMGHEHKGIACVWARMKIADLYDRAAYETNAELPAQIRQVALEYGLMSAYTAFVAVDSLTRTEGDHGITIGVPVPVPDGVRYETTVQER